LSHVFSDFDQLRSLLANALSVLKLLLAYIAAISFVSLSSARWVWLTNWCHWMRAAFGLGTGVAVGVAVGLGVAA
jgi:hypothetical protein